MRKIFCYELRRMAVSWLFLGLLLINGIFDWYVLSMDIIAGIADTAPFSVWSYLTYIGKTMPAVMVTVLLLLAGYYGKKQKGVEILTAAAPVAPAQHFLIRTAVLFACFSVLCLIAAGMAAVFYIRFFGYHRFGVFLLPSLLLMVPCFAFTVGLGHLLGRVHPGLIYLWMAVLAVGFQAVANAFDLFGAGYFSDYPLTLVPGRDGEPEFVMDKVWVIARILYLAAGLVMFWYNVHSSRHKVARDCA